MPYRKTTFIKNNFYHIFNRGVNRNIIFFSDDNYLYLLKRLREILAKDNQRVLAYCLMPNHYHFLIQQNGIVPLNKSIQAIFNSYSKGVNRRLNRSGPLFEGPFKCVPVDRDEYLVHLMRYIHRNPVEAGLVKLPEEWIYSNYIDYLDKRKGELVDIDTFSTYFSNISDYVEFVCDYNIEDPRGFEKICFD